MFIGELIGVYVSIEICNFKDFKFRIVGYLSDKPAQRGDRLQTSQSDWKSK